MALTVLDRDPVRGAVVAAETGAGFVETDAAYVAAAIATVRDTMGRITAVVNCVGIATGARVLGCHGRTRSMLSAACSRQILSADSTWRGLPLRRWPEIRPMRMAHAV